MRSINETTNSNMRLTGDQFKQNETPTVNKKTTAVLTDNAYANIENVN